jgi:quercetin dioxygenase-like cupin family protein
MTFSRLRSDIRALTLTLGIVALATLVTLPGAAAQQSQHHTVVAGDAVKWGPAPPSLPPGAQAAVLLGSPAKEGPFVLRLKFPAGYIVPPHRHSKDEAVTVISGRFVITSGEKVDRASVKALPAGSFFHMPAGMAHYALAETESEVQVSGMGPFDVTYIDPKDDPRKK